MVGTAWFGRNLGLKLHACNSLWQRGFWPAFLSNPTHHGQSQARTRKTVRPSATHRHLDSCGSDAAFFSGNHHRLPCAGQLGLERAGARLRAGFRLRQGAKQPVGVLARHPGVAAWPWALRGVFHQHIFAQDRPAAKSHALSQLAHAFLVRHPRCGGLVCRRAGGVDRGVLSVLLHGTRLGLAGGGDLFKPSQ